MGGVNAFRFAPLLTGNPFPHLYPIVISLFGFTLSFSFRSSFLLVVLSLSSCNGKALRNCARYFGLILTKMIPPSYCHEDPSYRTRYMVGRRAAHQQEGGKRVARARQTYECHTMGRPPRVREPRLCDPLRLAPLEGFLCPPLLLP